MPSSCFPNIRCGSCTRLCRALQLGLLLTVPLVLSACTSMGGDKPTPFRAKESFDSTTTYSRTYAANPARTCEAARRALLSQGYVMTETKADAVTGKKNFQPSPELHAQVDFKVVCTPDGVAASLAFANAVQDRYALKKSNNSASVGVGGIGSLSLPFNASDDSMVRVGSETVQDAEFYERFFALMERYLPAPGEPLPAPPAVATPVAPRSPARPSDVPPTMAPAPMPDAWTPQPEPLS